MQAMIGARVADDLVGRIGGGVECLDQPVEMLTGNALIELTEQSEPGRRRVEREQYGTSMPILTDPDVNGLSGGLRS